VSLANLAERWRSRADELEPFAAGPAQAFRRAADELEGEIRALDVESVTLSEASAIGGYSVDHLQRLVATAQLENVGRKHRPRVRRADVPVKPGHTLHEDGEGAHFSARRRIVASVSNAHTAETR